MSHVANCTSHHFACACREAHFDAVAQKHLKVEAENERLKRIVAKELSENDELGSEFVYVMALKEECARYREALERIKERASKGMTGWCYTEAEMALKQWDDRSQAEFEIMRLKARVARLEEHLALALSFCPKGPVPPFLAPMFYHTLSYDGDVELQKRIDAAREALKGLE